MKLWRDGFNAPKLLLWVTDGNGRQFAVADSAGEDPGHAGMDDGGAIGYWGWQWVGGTRRSHGFASRTGPKDAPTLSVFRNRLYDQSTGRWTQEDPIGVAGGINLYQFNGNNPAMFSDPFGLCPPADENIEDCPGDQKFIHMMAANGRGINAAVGLHAAVVGAVVTGGAVAELATAGGTLTLGIARAAPIAGAGAEPSRKMIDAFQRQLSQHGLASLQKSLESISGQLTRHLTKLADARAAGGRTSSIEREIRTFRRQLEAIQRVLEGN